MESTNKAEDGNQMTLHTTGDCSMDVRREETGKTLQKNCNHEKDDNAGCGVLSKPAGYGSVFNKNGGGVMAVEWRHEGIRMWQFGRDSIPSDIKGNNPKPDTWGTAVADFPNTHCDIGTHFKNQSIIANIDLCGSLVYHVWDDSGCKLAHILVRHNADYFQVRVNALISSPTTQKHLRMRIGSLGLSKYTRQVKPEFVQSRSCAVCSFESAALRTKGSSSCNYGIGSHCRHKFFC